MALNVDLAFGFERYFPRIYAYAMYRLQDPAAADDVTSKTFCAALSTPSTYDPEKGTLQVWLLGIARNQIRKHLRAQKVHKLISLERINVQSASDSRWIEEIAAQNEILARLLPLIDKLPAREHEVVALKFGAEMTNREIARILNLTESNVGVILYRTLRRLRDHLQEYADE